MAVQNALLKVPDFGYVLALTQNESSIKIAKNVAFFIDHGGYMDAYDYYEYSEFKSYKEEEINYEVAL